MKISPHVQIYKFPLSALSSISNRITGLYLTGVFIGGGIVLGINKEKELIDKYNNLKNYQQKIINYSLILPTTYHTLGGIRHFIWDKYPKLLTNKIGRQSSLVMFGLTLTLPLIIEPQIFKKSDHYAQNTYDTSKKEKKENANISKITSKP